MAHKEITVDVGKCKCTVSASVDGKRFDMSGEAAVVLPALGNFLVSTLSPLINKTSQLPRKAKHGG